MGSRWPVCHCQGFEDGFLRDAYTLGPLSHHWALCVLCPQTHLCHRGGKKRQPPCVPEAAETTLAEPASSSHKKGSISKDPLPPSLKQNVDVQQLALSAQISYLSSPGIDNAGFL